MHWFSLSFLLLEAPQKLQLPLQSPKNLLPKVVLVSMHPQRVVAGSVLYLLVLIPTLTSNFSVLYFFFTLLWYGSCGWQKKVNSQAYENSHLCGSVLNSNRTMASCEKKKNKNKKSIVDSGVRRQKVNKLNSEMWRNMYSMYVATNNYSNRCAWLQLVFGGVHIVPCMLCNRHFCPNSIHQSQIDIHN